MCFPVTALLANAGNERNDFRRNAKPDSVGLLGLIMKADQAIFFTAFLPAVEKRPGNKKKRQV
jgi:hypothetical protein